MTTRTATDRDRAIVDGFAAAGRIWAQLPEDKAFIQELMGPDADERPARRLADMARRNQIARVAHGAYLFLPPGARTERQAADRKAFVAAALDGRRDYYVAFASAIAEHGLTDEIVDDLYVAYAGSGKPVITDLAGIPVHLARVAHDDDGRWAGVERKRLRARAMYSVSGVERTLVDALARPDLCLRPEVWVRAWERALREERVDMLALLDLAKRRSRAVAARAALLLREAGRVRESRLLIDKPLSGRVLFNAAETDQGERLPRDRQTGLVLNVSQHAIDGWMGYGK